MFGCLTSIILGQNPKDVTAIAIETGVQNTGIAIMILKFSFPDADTSILMPVIVACSTPFPLLVSYGIHRLVKFIKNKSVSVDIEKESKIVSFNAVASSPKKSSFIFNEKDEHERPLIKNTPESEAERVAYLEKVLDQVVIPGVIPD
ncbi:hypothetical protein FO519_003058 [Halicephalobus sp. NKZ332]|nr:hypothetical protein FO519_003058 [Halicephalobus sp. NKZ332]